MGANEPEIVPLHAGFDVVYRGFHRRQVIEHIENLEEQLRFTSVDRAEALAQAADLRKLLEMTRVDLEEARARVERLEMSPDTTLGASERLHRMLLLAEDEAAELRLRAEREVDSLRKRTDVELAEQRRQAEEELAALRAAADRHARELREAAARRAAELDQREVDLERRRVEVEAHLQQRTEQVEAECAAAVAQAQEDADNLLRETAEQCNRLEAESEEKRAKAQNFFELTMTRRRNEAAQHFAEQEQLAKARAEFLIKMACREARRRIAEIEQHAEQLRDLRVTVTHQLSAARAALTAASDRVPGLIPEQTTSDEERVGA
ncbi:chromosome segregation ATPase [Saccharothrix tamanrassetensis]|uniref:Chromosome segregation ATPase n=1 Tax=Saccharothrix tamanrassetensis TaxID=1051531 RepID=A0A841CEI2_9PSEU|nr:hypothetical protein [Saccharothrix tamanrassetensis]MBB5955373.1 chromosome segregation ATPase [Saccharothrix tamanrassetensis]